MTIVSFGLYSEDPPAISRFREDLKEDHMDNETDTIGGYAVPMDPMDLLQCDSCQ
jgi:hypothetical protein